MAESPSLDNFNVTSPGPASELLGRLAFHVSEMQPFFPMYLHLILSALFPIYAGAHASLSRPSSAAKPPKREKAKDNIREEDEDEEEGRQTRMEGLSPTDAIMFPLLAGATLSGLYLLIKWLQNAALLNKILNWYFSGFAVFSVVRLATDSLVLLQGLAFPKYYLTSGLLWKFDDTRRKAIACNDSGSEENFKGSPLPGILSIIALPRTVNDSLWTVRIHLLRKLITRLHIKRLVKGKLSIGISGLVGASIGLFCVVYFNFVSRPWYLTNIIGFAFAYSALQFMSPTTFGTGSLILGALFLYDIYFVFYTPMMVTVAKELDVPIKLLFPRPAPEGAPPDQMNLSMLGLGDIVLPGIMMGLALRFDLYMHYLKKQQRKQIVRPKIENGNGKETRNENGNARHKEHDDQAEETSDKISDEIHWEVVKAPYRSVSGRWGDRFWSLSWTSILLPLFEKESESKLQSGEVVSFPKPYFYASISGYVLGMCVTLAVMQIADHAQPALLYLVPGVLGSVWLTGLVRGEIKEMWMYDETSEEDQENRQMQTDKTQENQQKKKASRKSLFSIEARSERTDSERKVSKTTIDEDDDGQAPTHSKVLETSGDEEELNHDKGKSSRSRSTKSSRKNVVSRDHPNELLFFSVTLPPLIVNKSGNGRSSSSESLGKDGTVKAESGSTSSRITPSAPDGPRVQRREVNGEPSGKRLRVS